ncbi:hypothetical protein JAAARDRAFT_192497 [Jaapia argillacea MUCL 33604]|uniref:Uncharacterized protein n=1 Tax=Jaapia argillacea MUCL 33604 TaxID=933084 RepID=A0A067PW56_9AGAM|nr:hypothetical protein JAAARDRAFT_192497 [Jaapia argillacea MUCL 33604]
MARFRYNSLIECLATGVLDVKPNCALGLTSGTDSEVFTASSASLRATLPNSGTHTQARSN